ncbi:FRG domain-containing protein [Tardiphaga sp. 42S5]|uniref:FRG domain-containing protein n=1 Tax=Tardiphaga sp. 42S5 TaxID=1404799 RepID=UPI002A5A5EBD|nr:FRG domain-containing protein [Tardiphaga sp. 42S5]WPO40625.1 FRG domain-containing protein [Tardiphaga sp. 42S5]
MPVRKVRNIAAYIDALRADQDGSARWFRGHGNAKWPLLPGIMRSRPGLSEASALARFKQSAAMLTERTPSSAFDWTFLMQHYGVPTRLLDWTESPLVAMFFAVDNFDKHRNADAAVWCLNPTLLNKNASISNAMELNYIPSFEADELKPYATEKLNVPNVELLPVATIATRNNPRIQAQLGTFTIHHTKKVAIEAVGDKSHATKYVIPSASRETIKKELKLLGLNQFSMFPELTSVGAILREMMA